ncbi:MAG: ECF transporter S component [Clostridiales bacterium]|nr:ECF transporter S component [Clostridiales bacterium]
MESKRKPFLIKLAVTAVLTAMASVLMYYEIPLPFMPPFLKFDFSEVPVVIGSFAIGPIWGVVIELLKNLIHLPMTQTAGIGEMSNFITGSIYVVTAGLIYNKFHSKPGIILSTSVATIVLALAGIPLNAFVTLPLYASVLGFTTEAIVGMSQAVNPLITDKWSLIMWGFVPFNLIKGIIIGVITFLVSLPLSRPLRAIRRKAGLKT